MHGEGAAWGLAHSQCSIQRNDPYCHCHHELNTGTYSQGDLVPAHFLYRAASHSPPSSPHLPRALPLPLSSLGPLVVQRDCPFPSVAGSTGPAHLSLGPRSPSFWMSQCPAPPGWFPGGKILPPPAPTPGPQPERRGAPCLVLMLGDTPVSDTCLVPGLQWHWPSHLYQGLRAVPGSPRSIRLARSGHREDEIHPCSQVALGILRSGPQ